MTAQTLEGNGPGPPPGRTREEPYRSFLTFTARPGMLELVVEQLAAWLRERKGWDADLSTTGFQRDRDRELLVIRHGGGNARNFRARLTEENPQTGAWRTELTVHVPDRGDKGWLLLDVSSEQGRFVRVPWLATYLIQTLDVRDGGDLRLGDSPTVIASDQVEELAEVVCDPARNGLVLVAGTNQEQPFDPFVQKVERWTRQVLGQAEVAVLQPDATRDFSDAVGHAHGVTPWTLRTFKPGVDPAVDDNALRHRFLTPERLARAKDGEIARLLGRVARGHAVSRRLPGEVTKVIRTLARVKNRHVVEAIERPRAAAPRTSLPPAIPQRTVPSPMAPPDRVEPPPAPRGVGAEAESYLAQIALVKQVLGLDVLDEGTLRDLARRASAGVDAAALGQVTRQLDEQQDLIERLQEEKRSLQGALEEEDLEHAIADEERARLEDEARWLRGRLREREDYEGAFAPIPETQITKYPTSYIELLGRLSELKSRGVIFTGDEKECRGLDDMDSWGKTARIAWEALLALCDYLDARRRGDWDQGVEGYLKRTPEGYRTMSAGKHAAGETNATMSRHGRERVFPVPDEVALEGTVVMKAHFKLGRIGMISPRMYYLDDYARSGKIYIGYIGEHPANTQTN